MYRGSGSRAIPIIIILIVIAIAIAALVSVGRAIFGGDQPAAQPDTSEQALLDSSVDHSVQMTVRGPLVADENFRSYQVVVSASSRTLTTYSGYLEQPIGSKQLGNNIKAYEEFVYALDKANLAKGAAFTGDKNDLRGICATGKVYDFAIMNGSTTVKELWTSTCKGSPGSLKASVSQLESLFLKQIPDNKNLLNAIKLSN